MRPYIQKHATQSSTIYPNKQEYLENVFTPTFILKELISGLVAQALNLDSKVYMR